MKKAVVFIIAVVILSALGVGAAADVKGTVVDNGGEPIAAAKVYVFEHSPEGMKKTLVYTDKDGNFSARCGANVSLLAAANHYTYGCATCQPDQEVTIKLWPESKLRGRVVDENGAPVEGATVRMGSVSAWSSAGDNAYFDLGPAQDAAQVMSGPDGAFTLLHLPSPDDFDWISGQISVEAPGRALINRRLQREDMTRDLEIADPPECKLQGMFYLPNKEGPAPEGTPVMVQVFRDGQEWEIRRCRAGKDGRFSLAQLPPGKVNVMLGSPGGTRGPDGRWIPSEQKWALPAELGVELSPEKPRDIELVLTTGAVVKCRAINRDDDKPIKSARVGIEHSGRPAGTPYDSMETDENGEFSARVAAGDVRIFVESIRSDERYVWFREEEQPSVRVQVAAGEEKADVVVKASPPESSTGAYSVADRPVPDDFELTPGTYELEWDPDLDSTGTASMRESIEGAEAKTAMTKLPKIISKLAKYQGVPFDGPGREGMLFIVLDESEKGWYTAYIDCDRDRDLADEKPIHFDGLPINQQVWTDWVTVQAHQGPLDGDHTDHSLQVMLSIYTKYFRCKLHKRGGWKGTLDSNKGKIECANVDVNCNGLYGDYMQISDDGASKIGDRVFADTNGVGRVELYSSGPQALMLYKPVRVGRKYYEISTSEIGDRITIQPYEGPLGKLLVRGENIQGHDAAVSRIFALGKMGYYDIQSSEWPIELPAGEYKINYCEMALLLDKDRKLSFSLAFENPVQVKPDEQTELTVSGEFSLAIDPNREEMAFRPGSSETISWQIKIGDKVTLQSIGDRSANQTPKINFYDSGGKLLKTTTAGYT